LRVWRAEALDCTDAHAIDAHPLALLSHTPLRRAQVKLTAPALMMRSGLGGPWHLHLDDDPATKAGSAGLIPAHPELG
jgi:hypothetical protein